jgi:NADH dehydrogenase FAD-containing subunit
MLSALGQSAPSASPRPGPSRGSCGKSWSSCTATGTAASLGVRRRSLADGDYLYGVHGCPRVLAIGDTAASNGWAGAGVPGLAPAAKQQGLHAANVIRAAIKGHPAPGAFRYRHYGNLATIGRLAAVVELRRLRLWGAPAWWLWGLAHVLLLAGGRNRTAVVLNWLWAYLTYRRGTRLITGNTMDV